MFDLAETMGQGGIQQLLNAEGVPSPKGGPWSWGSIRQYLTNRRYTGEAVFQGIALRYTPIISVEQFERVQARRATRKKA